MGPLQREHIHVRQGGRDGGHAARDTGGQQVRHIGKALGHLAAGPVNIRPVLKIDGDIGNRIFGHGPQIGLFGNAQHFHFHRRNHAALNFLGRHARGFEDDFDLRGADVGKRINGQRQERPCAPAGQGQRGGNNGQAPRKGLFNQARQHLNARRK